VGVAKPTLWVWLGSHRLRFFFFFFSLIWYGYPHFYFFHFSKIDDMLHDNWKMQNGCYYDRLDSRNSLILFYGIDS
jgi:hypothetical protein